MRRPLLPTLLLLVCFAASAAYATEAERWYALSGGPPGASASVEVVGSSPTGLDFELRVPGLLTRTVETAVGPRGSLDIPDGAVTGSVGVPRLPVLRYLIESPPGAGIDLQLVPDTLRQVSLEELGIATALVPVQPPVPKIEGADALVPYTEDHAAYATDAWMPVESAAVVDRAVLRGRHVALIEVRPVRYNPSAGQLELWSSATLQVRFAGGVPRVALRDRGRLISRHFDSWLERQLTRPTRPKHASHAAVAGGAAQGAVGLLVIAYDGFVPALEPLLDWKRKSGYKVELVTTSQLGGNPTDDDVKDAIQWRYGTWSAPSLEFVLLVGDTDFCPIHLGSGGGNWQVTDNWFACLDGPDYLPDVAVARISTRTAQETADVVDKLLTYEQATFVTPDWVKRAGFIGTNDSGHFPLIEGTHDWCIDTYYTPNDYEPTPWSHGYPSCDRHYRTVDADTSEIAASIDAGRSIVNYSGHGGYYSWEGPTSHGSYDQSDILNNTNDQMYPFVISNACITGSLDHTECFGETWQKAPQKGAIAFWGASNNSYWNEDDVLQRDLHGNIFPMDETPPIGVIINETKLDLYSYYGNTGTVAYYFDMYNLLSEPSLSLWTRVPRQLDVTHPAAHPIGESAFAVGVTHQGSAVAGALVAARKPDDGVMEAGYTDAAGSVTLSLDPAPESVGLLEVTVTGHDYRPYEDSTDVIAPDSPWLVYRSHVVDDGTGGDGDGAANPDEELVLAVTVENVGEQPGLGLAATLSTSTPQWCEILDDTATFPDLGPQEMGQTLDDHFRVRVKPETPNGVMLGLDLSWSAAGGAEGLTSFGEPVLAVELDLEGYEIDDGELGNGNGVAGPGETVDMILTVANMGLRDASGISGVLTTESPYVAILQGQADYPDLPAGDAGNAEPAYRFEVSGSAPDQQPVTFTLSLTEDGSGYVEVALFEVTISSCAVVPSNDVPKPINDNSTIESVLFYPHAVQIDEVDAFVDITHTYQGDLTVTLISPAGTSCVLHNGTGGGTDDIVTWYDDETQPAEPLSKFIGEDAYGTWRLVVSDDASQDTGSLNEWMLEICGEGLEPMPLLTVSGREVDDGDACDPDGMGDVGETVQLEVTVRNAGSDDATAVSASLSSADALAVMNGPIELPDLAPGQEAMAVFEVLVGAVDCMTLASFTVDLDANEGHWFSSFEFMLEADMRGTTSEERLEHGGAEPDGWTHSAAMGVDDWQVTSTRNHSVLGAWSWFAGSPPSLTDDRLVSPAYQLRGNSSLEFWHWIDLQSGYDGGVLEISDDGGASWTDLGNQILVGSYDRSLAGTNPLAGRDAWTGSFDEWRHVVVDLTPWSDALVRFRWRLTCDGAIARTGWWIDDVVLHSEEATCDAQPCGVPGEVELLAVDHGSEDVLIEWWGNPVCLDYRIWRSSDPTLAGAFIDVTAEDADPTDTSFLDTSGEPLLYWIVQGHGPDGDGPWGHFGQ